MFEVELVRELDSRLPVAKYNVYDIRTDKSGYPEFLIFGGVHDEWIWKSAKFFRPVESKLTFEKWPKSAGQEENKNDDEYGTLCILGAV